MATFSSGTNLVMTVIGFAVSAMFIVFVCTRLICTRIQLTASRRSFNASSAAAATAANGSDLSILERGIHLGLETSLVANFPTKNFSDHHFSSGRQDIQCTICLAEFQENDVLRILPCDHAFHVSCIDLWLKQNSTCPVCRTSLRYSYRKHRMQPIYSTAIRPSHPPEIFNSVAYQSPQPDELYSPGTMDEQRMDSAVRDELVSEPSGAREMASTEANCSAKTVCPSEAGEK